MRLHRSPKAFIEYFTGTRNVQIYLNSEVVAETTFILSTEEWVLIKPEGKLPTICDTLLVEAGTDIDSIVVSWGENVKFH